VRPWQGQGVFCPTFEDLTLKNHSGWIPSPFVAIRATFQILAVVSALKADGFSWQTFLMPEKVIGDRLVQRRINCLQYYPQRRQGIFALSQLISELGHLFPIPEVVQKGV
jgi:hypothetical protein